MRANGYLCPMHNKMLKTDYCRVCPTLFRIDVFSLSKARVIFELKNAVKLLEKSRDFAKIIPEVLTNIAYALPDAKSINDVAAFPSRICEVNGTPVASLDPEFGASKHLASVLLAVMQVRKNLRAAANIKYDEKVRQALLSLNLKFDFIVRRQEVMKEDITPILVKKVISQKPHLEVVIDPGGLFIEPATYVFAETPGKLVKKLISIAQRYALYVGNER